ncbi:MAG: EamA family transporter [Gammaproteobacteria bacterium]|nr:EamA family transporter [Gammaproteobacteria bacterium]
MKFFSIQSLNGSLGAGSGAVMYKNSALGIFFTLVSIVCFTVMDSMIKGMGATYPLHELIFFRCAAALLLVILFIWNQGGMKILRTQNPGLHVMRSMLGLAAMGCAFYGYTIMPLAEASSIFHTAPLLATAFSVPILGEKVGVRRWSCIVVGLIGVLIIVRPDGDVFNQGGVFMLFAAVMVALTTNIIRKLNAYNSAICITFYFTLSGTIVSAVSCLIFDWVPPNSIDWVWLIGLGLLGGLGQFTMTLSLRFGEVGLISPFRYTAIILATLIGFFVWAEVPDLISFVGMSIIICSGLYSMYRETRVKSTS